MIDMYMEIYRYIHTYIYIYIYIYTGAITRAHYELARERLRSIDALAIIGASSEGVTHNMYRDLEARLGWRTDQLNPMLMRRARADGSCALLGVDARRAREQNVWDLALWAEAQELKRQDDSFFRLPLVAEALLARRKEIGGLRCGFFSEHTDSMPRPAWPLQDIRSLQSFLALVNHPCIAPSICFAHTIAILLHD